MEYIDNSILRLLYEHRYIFAFLGALFEGTFIMLFTGVLYKLGYFNFWWLTAVLVFGYFLNGVIWYLVGKYGGNQVLDKWGKRLHVAGNLIEKLEEYFKNHSVKTIFITRVTYGFSLLSFMIAGSFRMKFKKFLFSSLAASIVWTWGLVGIGFLFGASYKALSVVTKSIAVGLAVILFLAIVLFSILFIYLLRYFARRKFIQDLENHDVGFIRKFGGLINRIFNNKK